MNNKEVFEIYIDSSWNDKFGQKSFGSFILYRDGKKVKEGTKKFNKRNYGSPEYDNFNRVASLINTEYYDKNKLQEFCFYSDCQGIITIVNRIKNQIKNNFKFDYNNIDAYHKTLIDTVRRFNGKITVKWIPREKNKEADLLAVNAFNEWLINQHMDNAKEYMIADLNYTLMKWKNHFGEEYKEARNIINQFEGFINKIDKCQ